MQRNLNEYIEKAAIRNEPKSWLFRTTEGQSGTLTGRPMSQPDVYRMIRRRAAGAGIETKTCCHTFRATGITEYYATAATSKWLNRWPTTTQGQGRRVLPVPGC